MRPTLRLVAAAAAAGAWLGLLLAGHAAGGAVHLLAGTALALAPWREPALPREGR